MKKFLLILGMVTCLATFTACGNADTTVNVNVTDDQVNAYVNAIISVLDDASEPAWQEYIDSVAAQGADVSGEEYSVEEISALVEKNYGAQGFTADVIKPALESYNTALDEMGAVQSFDNVTYTVDGKDISIKTTVHGAKKTATMTIGFNTKKGYTSCLTNVDYTLGEMMTTAGLNTLLGMGTVFCILILLMALISCFKLISVIEKKRAAKANAGATSVDNAVAQIVSNEDTQDDTELIAVIAAAIAASEGAASADGYVVRSIRRRY